MERYIKGRGVCPGVALAPQLMLGESPDGAIEPRAIPAPEPEIQRFSAALANTAAAIQRSLDTVERTIGKAESEIFEAQLLMLRDQTLLSEVEGTIRRDSVCAEWSFLQAIDQRIHMMSAVNSDYLRERVLDLRDIKRQVLERLSLRQEEERPAGSVILVAREIMPTQLIRFADGVVQGLVMEEGGATSHTVLLAAAMGVPCVVGAAGALEHSRGGAMALVNGATGEVVLEPGPQRLLLYEREREDQSRRQETQESFRGLPSRTADGRTVGLVCNIASQKEAAEAVHRDGEGVGLFRSEFLYLRERLPTEEEQYTIYAEAARLLEGRPLTIRTLDVGGDKPAPCLHMAAEPNPFMGCRAIRYCLGHPEIFESQLAAILRAAADADIRVMFPMIATMEELRQAKELVERVKDKLRAAGQPFGEKIPIGMMVEIPSAAIMADQFIHEVDFFSIGTNDLLQYLCSADRGNPKTAYLNDPCEPALLRMVNEVIRQANQAGKEVSICGQTAQDPLLIPLWLAMGVDKLSVSAVNVLALRQQIAGIDSGIWRQRLEQVLALPGAAEVRAYLGQFNQ